MRICRFALIALVLALRVSPLSAQPGSLLEAKLEIRVLDFVVEPDRRAEVAVLYDRDNAESLKDANQILNAFREAAGTARSKFLPKLVERHLLPQEIGLKAVVLPRGIADADDDILSYGVDNRTLILAGGTECVKHRQCGIGVATTPEIQIGVCGDLIRRSNIRFADGFQLMVKEF